MKKRHNPMRWCVPITLVVLVVGFLITALPASAAKVPAGRTYFVVSLGNTSDQSEAYELDAGCLRFTRDELCETDGDCGTWWRVAEQNRPKKQWAVGFEFDLIDDESGLPVTIEGLGRVDSRGPKSAIAGAAHAFEPTSGVTINLAISGRAVGESRCEQLVADFEAAQQ
ncbi:MAG: hypothetical protein GY769_04535 [bacterium]|nr:hypothetical protein [bacterium]